MARDEDRCGNIFQDYTEVCWDRRPGEEPRPTRPTSAAPHCPLCPRPHAALDSSTRTSAHCRPGTRDRRCACPPNSQPPSARRGADEGGSTLMRPHAQPPLRPVGFWRALDSLSTGKALLVVWRSLLGHDFPLHPAIPPTHHRAQPHLSLHPQPLVRVRPRSQRRPGVGPGRRLHLRRLRALPADPPGHHAPRPQPARIRRSPAPGARLRSLHNLLTPRPSHLSTSWRSAPTSRSMRRSISTHPPAPPRSRPRSMPCSPTTPVRSCS